MQNLIELESNFGKIIVEASGGEVYRSGEKKEISRKIFEKVIEPIKGISNAIIEKVCEIDSPPDNIEVELGLSFSGGADIFIAKVGSESTINIKMSWNNNIKGGIQNLEQS